MCSCQNYTFAFCDRWPGGWKDRMTGTINIEYKGQRSEKGKQEENADKDKEEEYLFTANWQLGNRRVRCILMQNTGQSSRGQTVQVKQNGKCFEVLSPCSYHSVTTKGCVNYPPPVPPPVFILIMGLPVAARSKSKTNYRAVLLHK